MNMNIESFDWGWMNESDLGTFHKNHILSEIFELRNYERFFQVEKNDVVVDVGASIGPFSYSILDKSPSRIYCIEPSIKEIPTLKKNVQGHNVEVVEKAISDKTGTVILNQVFGSNGENLELEGISFSDFVNQKKIDHIDFLKTDCEGGEYDIFNRENIWWIKNNVKKIVGEWHLRLANDDLTHKFREFRDIYLKLFPNHQIFSVDGVDIKWDLWNEHFINYYYHVIIYIDNR